ncbi:uncharacterized protein LOC118266489 isoform X1 [Spodoptera frugiperda]|uniref:Uncharacterized protein LOC118266489 isoform X1 n=1 Tax=Spodoptera frugiperda TaxID=7108 RepID=A0A9R0EHX2_SPOFR|nr:uncharacterized protein LOC118266489 isoform X1 [Spodoptera frugiperda]
MSRLGVSMFVCLLVLVALAACAEMPPNMKAPEPPKDSIRHDAQAPPPRPDGHPDTSRTDGRLDLPKEIPKPDAKSTQDGKS